MYRNPRPMLIGVVLFFLLSSACNVFSQITATPQGTIIANVVPTTAATNTPFVPSIPITGENVVEMQCQFCVNDRTHAVFIFPEFAIYDVESATPVTCLTAEVVNGKRVVMCNGTQSTSFNLKICSDSSNCLFFPVALQGCPLAGTPGAPSLTNPTPQSPVYLTPISTLSSSNGPDSSTTIPPQAPTQTNVAPPPATNMPPPPPTSTNAPPPPTQGGGGGEEGGEVVICHISPGNPDNRKTMTVSESDWKEEHSKHGDSLGACN